MQEQYPYVERRSAKRMKAELDLQFWDAEEENADRFITKTVDVSSKSLLFEEKQLLSIGTKVEFEVSIASLETTVSAMGRISRIQESEREGFFRYCIMFESISDEDRKTIDQYVEVIDINQLLKTGVEKGCSDLHLMAGFPPVLRNQGELAVHDHPVLTPGDLNFMILSMLDGKQREAFEEKRELNFSYLVSEGYRFRVNVHLDRGNLGASIRVIPSEIPPLPELGLPDEVVRFPEREKGLVLVTGMVGSGKTTTLNSMVDFINRNRKCMIISIEDPIEYVHCNQKSFIRQREVGRDTLSFSEGLKNALRQDPDVILVNDLRDPETLNMAIIAAETGHLVLATMNASGLVDCLEKMIDMFPKDQREQVRSRLASCLGGVSSQFLLPRKDGNGRVAVCEVMCMTSTLRRLIRDGKLNSNSQFMDAGFNTGIRDLDESLRSLVDQDLIDLEVAQSYARKPNSFLMRVGPA